MGANTKISWAHDTFNGWLGCIEYSAGCTNCYARELVTGRMGRPGLWGPAKTSDRLVTTDANWKKPLTWNRQAIAAGERRRVFAFSLSDWAEDHPTANATRPRFWDLIRATPGLDWLLLTKRAERLPDVLPDDWGNGWANVWLGTSIEDMRVAWRADALQKIPAAVRWISYEPNLGPLDDMPLHGIDWMVDGAESGPNRRPHDLAWSRSMRDRCAAAGIPYWYKQGSAFLPGQHPELDGHLHHGLPIPRTAWTQTA
jgi:protein gp37